MTNLVERIINTPVPSNRRPYKHQIEGLIFAETRPSINLLWGMGSGKTLGSILISRMRYTQENKLLRTLIVGPLVTVGNWKNEWAMYSNIPSNKVHALDQATSKKKVEYLLDNMSSDNKTLTEDGIIIVNYESIIQPDLAELIYEWKPEVIIMDEFHRCKSIKSKRTKVMKVLCERAKYKTFLSGTPILNNALDIFAPFLLLDKGETFGTNQFVFQSHYMRDANASWKGRTGYFPKWVNKPETFEELNRKVYSKSLRVKTEECIDLPELIEQQYEVSLSTKQKKMYNELVKEYITFLDEQEANGVKPTVTAQLAMVKALRLMQVTSGFVQDDLGNIHEIEDNPRLEYLEDLLEDIVVEGGNKCIVWCCFIHNYKMLQKLCDKLKIKYTMLTGSQSGAEKTESVEKFQNDPSVKVMIANKASGGIGVNLTAANYSITYSRNYSLEQELQANARNYRGGSKELHDKIIRIDLLAKGTVDELAFQALRSKQMISELIIDRKNITKL